MSRSGLADRSVGLGRIRPCPSRLLSIGNAVGGHAFQPRLIHTTRDAVLSDDGAALMWEQEVQVGLRIHPGLLCFMGGCCAGELGVGSAAGP